MSALACPSCGKDMELRDSPNGKFFGCTGYPTCRRRIHSDPDGNPFVPETAGLDTIAWRHAAHSAFDILWKLVPGRKERARARCEAYLWMHERLGIQKEWCHITLLSKEQSQKLLLDVLERLGLLEENA